MTLYLNANSIDGIGSVGYANFSHFNQGTWSPEVWDSTNAQASFSSSAGVYTRVGDLVTIWGRVISIDESDFGSWGILEIRNLPYTCNTSHYGLGGVRVYYIKGGTGNNGHNWQTQVYPNTTKMRFSVHGHVSGTRVDSGVFLADTVIDTGDNTSLWFNATYAAA